MQNYAYFVIKPLDAIKMLVGLSDDEQSILFKIVYFCV